MAAKRLITPDFREYALAELRTARIRAKMYVNEIETIGVALRAHLVEPEEAMEWMRVAGTLAFLLPTIPEPERITQEMIEGGDHDAMPVGAG